MTQLLFISGSLRQDSSSTALLRALEQRIKSVPAVTDVTYADIGALPHYNADRAMNEEIRNLVDAIATADGVVIATPEYNFSIPGVLKNAIDWASRPAYQSVFKGKPVFVLSVSGGALGGVRAQGHLKYILNGMLAEVFPWQEIVVPAAPKKLIEGTFEDQAVLDFATEGLMAFVSRLNS